MGRLSKTSEKRILDALEKAASLIGDGVTPNDALIKVAGEDKIPAGHVRLMVNAINTGRTNAHRTTNDDPLEKASEFTLADASTVLEALYPDELLTKKAAYSESVVADEYARPPTWLEDHKKFVKAASPINWKMTDKKVVIERDPAYVVKKACGDVRRKHIEVEETSRKTTKVRQDAMKVAEELRSYFKRPGHDNFVQVQQNSILLFGKQAETVLDHCVDKVPLEKISSRKNIPVNLNAEPYSLIKKAIDLSNQFKECQEAHTAAVKSANATAHELLRPFGPGPENGHSVLEDLSSPANVKSAGPLGTFLLRGLGAFNAADLGRDIAKRMPGPTQTMSDLDRSDFQSLTDPMHESEIRNIQSESLLNDLMANDEVIRGYDPEEVIDAFNEVSQLTPYAVNKKAIMRDMMRRRLSGGGQALDQFAIGDTLRSQEALKNLDTMAEPNYNMLKDMSSLSKLMGPAHGKSVLA